MILNRYLFLLWWAATPFARRRKGLVALAYRTRSNRCTMPKFHCDVNNIRWWLLTINHNYSYINNRRLQKYDSCLPAHSLKAFRGFITIISDVLILSSVAYQKRCEGKRSMQRLSSVGKTVSLKKLHYDLWLQ